MEFSFNINNLFASGISVVDRYLTPHCSTLETSCQRKDELRKVIDDMGEASARAQNLHGPITSASRLSQSSHHLYIKKDAEANNGYGSVVGFLKVGKKKLFVYDGNGVQHETEPLCVLDFYVCESCQRRGSGKQLFDVMLRRESIQPTELAIDRPSSKCLSFLSRHFDLHSVIPQVNNFVVYDGFFQDHSGGKLYKVPNRVESVPYQFPKQVDFSSQSDAVRGRHDSLASNHFADRGDRAVECRPDKVENCRGHGNDADLKIFRADNSEPAVRPPSNTGSWRLDGMTPDRLQMLGMGGHHVMYSRHQMSGPLAADDGIAVVATVADSKDARNQADGQPLVQRDGPPFEHRRISGSADYLGRRGHLRVGPLSPSYPGTTDFYESMRSQAIQRRQLQHDTAFNIFGVPRPSLLRPVDANQAPYNRRTALW